MPRYWVTYTGGLASSDHELRVDDGAVGLFLRYLASHLIANGDGSCLGSSDEPGGMVRLVLSGAFAANDDASALKEAREKYTEAIRAAGLKAVLPDGSHPAWRAEELLKTGTVRVLEPV